MRIHKTVALTLCLSLLAVTLASTHLAAADVAATGWTGRKANWNGFEQYHFQVDGRNCYVVLPKEALAGKPWIWRARFPGYHAEMDVALVGEGFHLAYMDVGGMLGSPTAIGHMEKFYQHLTTARGLGETPVMEGVSRGGLFVYQWLIKHPDKAACVYADTPVLDFKSWPLGRGKGKGHEGTWRQCLKVYGMTQEEAIGYEGNPVDQAAAIAKAGVPLLHIVSENDSIVPPSENTYALKSRLEKLGRTIEIISVKQGTAKSSGHHFAHPEQQRVVDFVLEHGTASETKGRSDDDGKVAPIKALLVTGGSSHDYDSQKLILTEGVAARVNVEWTIAHQGGKNRNKMIELFDSPDWAKKYDVVVHNICFGGVTDVKFVERVAQAHEAGTPAVVIHCAVHSFRHAKTDAWRKVVGVSSFSHEGHRPLEVKNLAVDHPVMQGFPKVWKTPNGELYKIAKQWPNCKPLASAYGEDTKKNHTCVWTNTVGKGRVFGTTIGHHNETMREATYLDLVSRGLLWACNKLDDDGKPKPGYGGNASKKSDKAGLTGSITFRSDEAAFDGATAWIRLWEYDPLLADASAKLVDDAKVEKISHAKGKPTTKVFKLGGKVTPNPRRKYYVTIFVYRDGKVGDRSSESFFLDGFNKVDLPGKLDGVLKKLKR